jgi:peptidoglycan hydrolase-like protein with peptidoglycan-binding domain
VRWLQYELSQHGYKLIVDGIAGPKTIESLTHYQMHHDLVPDGICGPLTRASLKI